MKPIPTINEAVVKANAPCANSAARGAQAMLDLLEQRGLIRTAGDEQNNWRVSELRPKYDSYGQFVGYE